MYAYAYAYAYVHARSRYRVEMQLEELRGDKEAIQQLEALVAEHERHAAGGPYPYPYPYP